MGWELDKYRALVEEHLGSQALGEVRPIIGTLAWKFALARFHAAQARSELEGHFQKQGQEQIAEAVGKILRMASGQEDAESFARSRFAIEAHVIACAQALHSTADVLAYSLYHGLGLTTVRSLPDDEIGIRKVLRVMETCRWLPRSVKEIEHFLESEEFRYVQAYVNTAKHKRLVDTQYQVQLEPWEEARHGVFIHPFAYRTKHVEEAWPKKWVDDLTGPDLDAISEMIGRIGNTVNAELEQHIAARH